MQNVIRPYVGVALLLVAAESGAVETLVTADIGTEWTDNALLSSTERRSDVIETLGIGASLADTASWYNYNLNYAINHERYQRDSFDPNTFYNGVAALTWIPIPNRFDWGFAVSSQVTLQQTTAPNTPDNRDQRHTYSTTPRVVLLAMPRDTLSLQGEATRVDFDQSEESDSDRLGGSMLLDHRLNELTSLLALVRQQNVTFENLEDYDSATAQLGFSRQLNGGEITAYVGQTRITPEIAPEIDGVSYQVNYNWTDDVHLIGLQFYRDLTDTTVQLPGELTPDPVTPPDIGTDQVQVITRTRYSANYVYNLSKTIAFDSTLYIDEESGETNDLDTNRKGGVVSMNKNISEDLKFIFSFNFDKLDDRAVAYEEITRQYQLALEKELGKILAISGWLGRLESQRKEKELSYEQHMVGLKLTARF